MVVFVRALVQAQIWKKYKPVILVGPKFYIFQFLEFLSVFEEEKSCNNKLELHEFFSLRDFCCFA